MLFQPVLGLYQKILIQIWQNAGLSKSGTINLPKLVQKGVLFVSLLVEQNIGHSIEKGVPNEPLLVK